jgi:hypothetical protein
MFGGFPFEAFEEMHGGRMPGGMRGAKSKPVDNTKYYNLLGVEKNATMD